MAVDWTKTTALVTGASSGIGRALAVEMARRGARVGLLARRAAALDEIVRELQAAGSAALSLPADVRDGEAVAAAVEELRRSFGPINMLIANAGIGDLTPATRFDRARATEIVAVNLVGAINCVAAVLPDMLAQRRGHLVAVSSLAAYRGLPGSSAYSASKAGLSTFFESLRLDLRSFGVKVTIIHPGFIRTPMTEPRRGPMPYLLELPDATRRILRAIERERRCYAFPWQLAMVVRLLRLLPDALYDRLMERATVRR